MMNSFIGSLKIEKNSGLPRIGNTINSYSGVNQDAIEKQLDFEVGVCSHQGRRPYQEDEYSLRPYLRGTNSIPESHLFAIFDGHAGGKCSKYLSTNLNEIFQNDSSYDANIGVALKRSYFVANEQFLKHAERLKLHDGSTGITSVLREGKLHIANVGDCRAVIVRRDTSVQVTTDHKPTDIEEQKRIGLLGGTVVNCMGTYRVNGILAVSRAFGNRTIKQVIRPDPDIFCRNLINGDDFLVMGSDGLWDVMQNKDLNDICYTFAIQGCKRIAEELVKAALMRGSMDNITCLVINLQRYVTKWNSIAENNDRRQKFKPGNYTKTTSNESSHQPTPSRPLTAEHDQIILPIGISGGANDSNFGGNVQKIEENGMFPSNNSKNSSITRNYFDLKADQSRLKSDGGKQKVNRDIAGTEASSFDDVDEEVNSLLGKIQNRYQPSSKHRLSRSSNISSTNDASSRFMQRRPLSTMHGVRTNGATSPAVSIGSNRSSDSPTLSISGNSAREDLYAGVLDASKSTSVRIGSGIRNFDATMQALKAPVLNFTNTNMNKFRSNSRPATRGY